MRWAALLWLLGSCAAVAQPLDTAAAFDSYTKGKTLYFGFNGETAPSAAETYLPGQRVRWFTQAGTCITGEWYAEAGQICFVYENNPTPQCWVTTLEASGLTARQSNSGGLSVVHELPAPQEPFQCLGPQVGV